MKKLIHLYVPITRVDDSNPDYTIVEGYAYVNAKVASDKANLTRSAMEAATPGYLQFPAIREMHTAWAAGTSDAAQWDEHGVKIVTRIVDAEARLKVKEGVYRGFSVGVRPTKVTKAGDVLSCDWIETSLVDRPADPDALFTVVRAEPEVDIEPEIVEDAEPEPDADPIRRKDFTDYMSSREPHELREAAISWLHRSVYDAQKHDKPDERADLVSKSCDQFRDYMRSVVANQAVSGTAIPGPGSHKVDAPEEASDMYEYCEAATVTRVADAEPDTEPSETEVIPLERFTALETEHAATIERVSALTAERDAALARVTELEAIRVTKQGARYTQDLDPKAIERAFAANKEAGSQAAAAAEQRLQEINALSRADLAAMTQRQRDELAIEIGNLKFELA